MVHHMGPIDLGFTGPHFTWNHGSHVLKRKSGRLDRSICDKTGGTNFLKQRSCIYPMLTLSIALSFSGQIKWLTEALDDDHFKSMSA